MNRIGGAAIIGAFLLSMASSLGALDTEIQPSYNYKGHDLRDPFLPISATGLERVVYIIDLRMTAIVSSGATRVALFRRDEGPKTVYRLRYGRLLGNDGKPLPGITGSFLKDDPDVCVLIQGDKELSFRVPGL